MYRLTTTLTDNTQAMKYFAHANLVTPTLNYNTY